VVLVQEFAAAEARGHVEWAPYAKAGAVAAADEDNVGAFRCPIAGTVAKMIVDIWFRFEGQL